MTKTAIVGGTYSFIAKKKKRGQIRAVLVQPASRRDSFVRSPKDTGSSWSWSWPRLMVYSAFPHTASSVMSVPCHCFHKIPGFALKSIYWTILSSCLNFLLSGQSVELSPQ